MFKHIMAPVDLNHIDNLGRALEVTADMARHHGAKVTFVSVGTSAPGSVAHSPEEFKEKLAAVAKEQAEAEGIDAGSHAVTVPDKRMDLDDALLNAAKELGVDLVVMASHPPSIADHFWSSNGGAVARHCDASVMIVRER